MTRSSVEPEKAMVQNSYEERLAEWNRARFAPSPEPDLIPAQPTLVEMASMRDGVRLHTEVYLPDRQGQFPVILVRSVYPYSRPSRNDKRPISRYLEAGFAFVFQVTRGQYKSEGEFRFLTGDIADGQDCINWVESQSWCDGNIGMEGASYLGATQFMALKSKPPALKCIIPTAFPGHIDDSAFYTGGIPARGWCLQWHNFADIDDMADLDVPYGEGALMKHNRWGPAMRKRPLIDAADGILEGDKLQSWYQMMSSPQGDELWESLRYTDADLADIDIPVFFIGGWLDPTIGPVEYFCRLEQLNNRDDRFLMVGPWSHFQTSDVQAQKNDNGLREMHASSTVDLVGLYLVFFDRYLRGNKDNEVQLDPIKIFISGADKWQSYPTFPPPEQQLQKIYLHSAGRADSFPGDGSLSWELPENEPTDSYIYDPTFATPEEAQAYQDRRDIEVRGDVLTYTSPPLEKPLTILGDINLVLFAASDARDTDWWAALTEVFPDGRSVAFHGAFPGIRARYRNGRDKEELLKPEEPVELRIPLGSAGHQLPVGSRLRLSICSAMFPGFDANTNTGSPAISDTEYRVARQTIFHDDLRPSHIILPTIETDQIGISP